MKPLKCNKENAVLFSKINLFNKEAIYKYTATKREVRYLV